MTLLATHCFFCRTLLPIIAQLEYSAGELSIAY
jgi:hypothetical protein